MTIIISIISSILAAFLAHYFATTRLKINELKKFQLLAYSDFIGAASRLAVLRRLGNTGSENDELAALNDAKNRIIVSGSTLVVSEVIKFWERGATLEREQELLAFKCLLQEIRKSLGHKKNDLIDLDISNALFKLEPSYYSFRAERADV